MKEARELALIALAVLIALLVVSVTSSSVRIDASSHTPHEDIELNWAYRMVCEITGANE